MTVVADVSEHGIDNLRGCSDYIRVKPDAIFGRSGSLSSDIPLTIRNRRWIRAGRVAPTVRRGGMIDFVMLAAAM
jgi:hypothetical protein